MPCPGATRLVPSEETGVMTMCWSSFPVLAFAGRQLVYGGMILVDFERGREVVGEEFELGEVGGI